MIERIAKAIILLLCPILGYGYGISFYRLISDAAVPEHFYPFAIGFALFLGIWLIFRRQLSIVCTFEHEITHLLFGLLFFKIPRGFRVTFRDGGHVKLKGSNFLIYLAPYFFPTVSFLILAMLLVVPYTYLPVFIGILGASVAFHIVSTWAEIDLRQTDLQQSGLLFSIIFLPVANLIVFGFLTAFIIGSEGASVRFLTTGLSEGLNGVLILVGQG